MRTGIMVIIAILIASTTLAMAQPPPVTPTIVIDDGDNKVKFDKFSVGDPWHVIMTDPVSGNVLYDFSGIAQGGDPNPNHFIWFSEVSPGALKNGIQKCIVQGSYDVHAEIVHDGITYTENGFITVEAANTCEPPIPPIPELGTIVLTSAGMLGLVLISRKYR